MSVTNAQAIQGAESREAIPLHYRIAHEFEKLLKLIRMPNKVISTLFGWAEMIYPSESWQTFLTAQRYTIKAVASTFALPKLIIKQVKLFEAWSHLKNSLTQEMPAKLEKIAGEVKKVFLSFLSCLAAGLKIPQLLDKTQVVDLSKISRLLPSVLRRAECLLSLALSSMKFIDTAWNLQEQLEKENANAPHHSGHSAKTKSLIFKLGTSSIKIVSDSINAASLFLGWYATPIVNLTVSTISLTASVVSKLVRNSHLFGMKEPKNSQEAASVLPA